MKAAVQVQLEGLTGLQADRWNKAGIRPNWQIAVDKEVMFYLRNEERYKAIEKMRGDGVPAPVIFCLHYRESSHSFGRHLHEGSSLLHRTRDEPKGRLPHPDPPYTFEQSAEDAIYVCDRLQGPFWRSDLTKSLDKIEGFNGYGYRRLGVPSPYMYSGTTVYDGGKFIADHVFSRNAKDQQLGCVALLKRLKEKGIAISFVP
jgi:lysozyme family protein